MLGLATIVWQLRKKMRRKGCCSALPARRCRYLRINPAASDRALLDQVAQLDHPLIGELLHPLTAIGLGGVDIALGIGDDAVHGIELTRLTTAAAEPIEFLHGLAVEDMDVLVGA